LLFDKTEDFEKERVLVIRPEPVKTDVRVLDALRLRSRDLAKAFVPPKTRDAVKTFDIEAVGDSLAVGDRLGVGRSVLDIDGVGDLLIVGLGVSDLLRVAAGDWLGLGDLE
jgi:hypothetical protein